MGIQPIKKDLFLIKARVKRNGLDLRKQERFHGTRPEAELRYMQFLKELRGEKPKAKTFGDLLTAYYAARGPLGDSYESVYKHVSADLAEVRIPELESKLIEYRALLKLSRSRKTGERLTGAALNRARTLINAVLNLAKATGKIERNPLTSELWPKVKEKPRERFLSPMEAQRLLNVIEVEAPHLSAITRFALQVPCRKGELVKMTRDDLDLFGNVIRVPDENAKDGMGSWKPIPPDMVAYFRSLPPETPFLFFRMTKRGPVALGDFKRAWARVKRLAGVRDFHFHDTRHISATDMIDAGTPERAVAKVAGWADLKMIRRYHNPHRALSLIKFRTGGATYGATPSQEGQEDGANATERAVS